MTIKNHQSGNNINFSIGDSKNAETPPKGLIQNPWVVGIGTGLAIAAITYFASSIFGLLF